MKIILVFVVLFYFQSNVSGRKRALVPVQRPPIRDEGNTRPIIGVLSQRLDHGLQIKYRWARSYIASSYVKFLEMGGARVVPILNEGSEYYYEDLFNSLNGLLIPGGSADLVDSGFAKAATKFYKLAVQANDKGDYFPIWGTCLGFEMLSILLTSNQKSWLTSCDSNDTALPLNFTTDMSKSRLFQHLPTDVFTILSTKPVTANFHHKCLTPKNVTESGLNNSIGVLSTNQDKNGLVFVSTFEALKYPFYAVQWHPEKNPFEWTLKEKNIPHSFAAMQVTQYMANFFVQEARQSKHQFHKVEDETKALIYNTQAYNTIDANTTFTQVYLFHNVTQL